VRADRDSDLFSKRITADAQVLVDAHGPPVVFDHGKVGVPFAAAVQHVEWSQVGHTREFEESTTESEQRILCHLDDERILDLDPSGLSNDLADETQAVVGLWTVCQRPKGSAK
jgi:hypothetical protein